MYAGGDVAADASWFLQPFQAGEPPSYIEHLRAAVELTARDAEAILILSGGCTRREAGRKSEASGYRDAADAMGWWGFANVRERTHLEEYARDSFENLRFSVLLAERLGGSKPDSVTVAGWAFKEERFRFHAETIGLGAVFDYVGVNQPADLASALEGERRTLEAFRRDPWGEGSALFEKRTRRDPFGTIALAPWRQACSSDFRI